MKFTKMEIFVQLLCHEKMKLKKGYRKICSSLGPVENIEVRNDTILGYFSVRTKLGVLF